MPTYKAPVDDVLFLLNDVFHIDRYGNLPGFADASPDVVEAVLRRGGQILRGSAAPRSTASATRKAASAPADGSVTTPTGFKDAYKQHRRGRLDRHFGAGRIRRPGAAGDHDAASSTNSCARPTWRSRCIRA